MDDNFSKCDLDTLKMVQNKLEATRWQITLARCTLERKIQASDYVRSSHESDPAQYALAGMICTDINEFIHLAHDWVEKAEASVETALDALIADLSQRDKMVSLPSEPARMEHAPETPAGGVDEKALRRLAEQHWEAHKALHATDADGGKCYRTEEDKREFIAAWTQTERRVFEAYERAKAEGGE